MVDISTQTISNTEINSRDLSPSKNDTYFATIMNKTQIERVDRHSKQRDVINFDPAIVSIGRSDDNQRLQHHDTSYASNLHCQTRTDDPQQLNVVDQMIAQPQIPYALLPKHFKPKQISNDRNPQQSSLLIDNDDGSRRSQQQNYFKDNDQEHELMVSRHFVPTNRYYEPCIKDYYNSYSHRPPQNCSPLSFNIVSSYDINKWQDSYAKSQQFLYPQQQCGGFRYRRNDDDCIRDDHRINTSKRQSRNDKGAKAYKISDNDY